MPASSPLRVGVVGLGLVAQAAHLPALVRSPRFCVTHVCDLSQQLAAEIAAELPDAPRASCEIDDVLADPHVDAVLLLTPGAHARQAIDALRAGKHVLAEKPLAIAPWQAIEASATAERAGRVLQVGYMKMHDELVEPAREALAGLGGVRGVRVTVLHPADARQTAHLDIRRGAGADLERVARATSDELAVASAALAGLDGEIVQLYRGVLLGSVVHELSLLRALGLGLPQRFSFAAAYRGPAGEAPRLHAVGTLPGGAVLDLSWHYLPDLPRYVEEVSVLGSAGHLTLGMPPPYAADEPSRLRVERDGAAPTQRESGTASAFDRALAAFADAIAGGAPVRATALGAAADTRCLLELAQTIAATATAAAAARRPRLASAPASFGVGGATGDGRHAPPSADAVLAMIAEAGYDGAEVGPPGLLGSPLELHERLAAHGLAAVGAYVPLALGADDAAFDASLAGLRATLDQLTGGGDTDALAILADAGSDALRERLLRGADPDETALDDDGWRTLQRRLAQACRLAAAAGVRTSFHPHLATHVETAAELARLLRDSEIGLTLDTAHLQLAGIDPVAVVERHGDRIDHVHLKDARPEALARVREQERTDFDVWWEELFCPLGDGAVDAEGVVAALVAAGYDGWLVVEQDRAPFARAQRDRIVAEEAANRRWLAAALDRVPGHTVIVA